MQELKDAYKQWQAAESAASELRTTFFRELEALPEAKALAALVTPSRENQALAMEADDDSLPGNQREVSAAKQALLRKVQEELSGPGTEAAPQAVLNVVTQFTHLHQFPQMPQRRVG